MTEVKSLYIHIPYCISKCKYCDFFSVPCGKKTPQVPEEYMEALSNEIIYRISQFNIKEIETIYIGGGTPSLLSKKQLHKIFSVIKENTLLADNCEITIESNPDDITKELIESWKEESINRISLGIQSFNDNALSYVSRRASSSINKQALALIKEYWKNDLSVDLICGLPKQDSSSFIKDLIYIGKCRPDHISMYSLTIEEETPLGREYYSGHLNYDFDMADELWLLSRKTLEEIGYNHYEVSNFSLPGKECRHNLKYWNHESYVGCGSGGAGTVYNNDGSGSRWTNITDINKYVSFWNNRKPSDLENLPEIKESISVETSIFEFFMMGMRKLSGVKESDFERTFNKKIPEKILNSLNNWAEKGLCNITSCENGNIYTLGHKGILYLNLFLEEII